MIRNIVIATGGVAQDLVSANLGRTQLIIEPQTEDCWINFGTTNAAVNVGERVPVNSSASFTVWRWPEVGGRVSVFSATTNANIVVRES